MGLSLAAVSRRLTQLESRLGVTLLHRTTRSLSLTERGRALYERASHLLAEIETAEEEIAGGADAMVGQLRITATMEFGRRRLAPLLQEFRQLNPGLRIHLDTTNQDVNVIDGGYDLAIRFGDLPDSRLMVRRLAPNPRVICAAPGYLRQRGRPRDVSDLAHHDCIVVGSADETRWRLGDGHVLRLQRPMTTNDAELAHAWALGGAGLALKSLWDVQDDLTSQRLEVVLPHFALPDSSVNAVYPKSREAAAKVQRCVEFLTERLRAAGRNLEPAVAQSA